MSTNAKQQPDAELSWERKAAVFFALNSRRTLYLARALCYLLSRQSGLSSFISPYLCNLTSFSPPPLFALNSLRQRADEPANLCRSGFERGGPHLFLDLLLQCEHDRSL